MFALVGRIPYGHVTSYGRVAEALGFRGKAREVGWALHSIPRGLELNPHRVIRHDGSMAGGSAFGAPEVQRALLEQEDVTFLSSGRVDLKRHLWAEIDARIAAIEILRPEI